MPAVALQEWAAICDRLGAGQQILTVRKGGIHERGGGLFALEYARFALLPTYLHQDASRLHPGTPVPVDPSPGVHRIAVWAEATEIWKVTDRRLLDGIADDLPWTAAELDARFAYKGQPVLFVIALRVHRLPTVLEIPDHPSYAGCRSWIPLQTPVDPNGSVPVVDDATFTRRLALAAASLHS
jgi:hypothetical protein